MPYAYCEVCRVAGRLVILSNKCPNHSITKIVCMYKVLNYYTYNYLSRVMGGHFCLFSVLLASLLLCILRSMQSILRSMQSNREANNTENKQKCPPIMTFDK
jgi:uncharacterized membrane protein